MAIPAYETARPDVQAHVPVTARRVLDLGCAAGALGAALRGHGAEVVGVERDPGYARAAAVRLDRVIDADLAELATRPGLRDELGRFDCLIAADVLEHLVDPWTALDAFAGLLEPGGRAIVSLPNVRSWETFWQLARHGRWPRRSAGLFDRTHLRWFTLADAHDLVTGAGLTVERVDRRLLRGDGRPWPRLVARVAAHVPGLRTLLCLQHVIVASAPAPAAAPRDRARAASRQGRG